MNTWKACFYINERLFIKMSEIPKEVPFSPKPEMQNPPEKKAEPAPPPIPPEAVHPDTTAIHSEKRVIDLRSISFEVDPMVAHKIQMQMQDNPRFAQTIHTNITKLFYDYIIYKVRMRENLNLAIKGETRCLSGNTLVPTDNGLLRIEDIKVGQNILSFATSPSRRYFTWMPVTEKFIYPNKPTLKIAFSDGSTVTCTPNHPLYRLNTHRKIHSHGADAKSTTGKWVRADQLSDGDKIYTPLDYPDFGNPVDHRLARLLGFIIGDGTLYKKTDAPRHKKYINKDGKIITHHWKQLLERIQFFNTESCLLTQFKTDFESFFNTPLCRYRDKRNGLQILASANQRNFSFIHSIIQVSGKAKSGSVEIPDIIKQANRESKKQFLRALFSTDGWISNKIHDFEYSSKSRKLISDVQLILLEFGITSTSRIKHKEKSAWSVLNVKGRFNFNKLQNIGFISKKKQSRLKMILNRSFGRKSKHRFFRSIHSIYFNGLETVYDLHIPQTHCIIANGSLTHNSGKSTVGLSFGHFISSITRIPYTAYHICANESEYYSKVKNAKFSELYHIDEQKESKFGAGSFREEMSIMDLQNIIAKQCVHTIWIYPSDFIARNSVYGLETYGKDLKNKLIRCIVYDIRKTVMGMSTPLGYIIVPKIQDLAYQNMPETQWDKYRIKNKYELKRPDFDSLLEEDYEKKKDEWIEREKGREGAGFHHEERFKLGVWLGQQKQYTVLEKKAERRALARQVFRDLTEAEVDEIVVIADMKINPEDIAKLTKKKAADARKEVDEKG
jgi:intein/homing endonuclease